MVRALWHTCLNYTPTLCFSILTTGIQDNSYGQANQADSPLLLDRQYTTTSREILETLKRMENFFSFTASVHGSGSTPLSTNVTIVEKKLCCIMLPPMPVRFFNRTEVFDKIDEVLGPVETQISFRSIALYGIGGIGKSVIAGTYAKKKIEGNEYDAVFWVHGEKTVALRQSFTDIAMRLKLPDAHPQNHDDNLRLVQSWFQTTGETSLYDSPDRAIS